MGFTIWHNWRLYWYRFSLSHPIDWLNIFWHPRWHMANLSCHSLINIFESKSVWSHHCCDHLFSMTLGSCKMNPFPQQCFKIHWRSITLLTHPSPSSAMVCSFLPAHEKMLLKTIELHCRYNVPTLHLRVTQMYLVVFVFLGIFIIVFYGWTLSFPGILTLTHTQVILKFATPGS